MFDKQYEPSEDVLLLDKAHDHIDDAIDVSELLEKVYEGDITADEYLVNLNETIRENETEMGLESFKFSKSFLSIVPKATTSFLNLWYESTYVIPIGDSNIERKLLSIIEDEDGWDKLSTIQLEQVNKLNKEIVLETIPECIELMKNSDKYINKALSLFATATSDYNIEDQIKDIDEYLVSLPQIPANIISRDEICYTGDENASLSPSFTKEEFVKLLQTLIHIKDTYAKKENKYIISVHQGHTQLTYLAFKIIEMCEKANLDKPDKSLLKLAEISKFSNELVHIPEFINIYIASANVRLLKLYNAYKDN